MKSIYTSFTLLAILLFGCHTQESSWQCSCTIKEMVDAKKEREQENSNQNWGGKASAEIEALVKKAVDAKIGISGSYSNSNTKIEEVYTEIIIANPQITQKANLYRTVACAYYEIVCQDKSLSDKDKSAKLNEVVAGYERNINNIINEEKPKKGEIISNAKIAAPTINSEIKHRDKSSEIDDNRRETGDADNSESKKRIEVPSTNTKNQNKLRLESDEYLFEINECKWAGENIQINLTVMSKGKDRNLGIATRVQQGASKMHDNLNGEYLIQRIKIANEATREGGGSINKILIKNIPTAVSLFFSDINTEAKSVSLLSIGCYGDFDPIQFRNIPIGYENAKKINETPEISNTQNNHKYDNGDYVFRLNECKRQGENVIIKLKAISKGKDRKLGIATRVQQGATKMYDNFNNEYLIQRIKIANETTQDGGGSITKTLINGIETDISLTFSDVNTEAKSISMLSIGCYSDFDPIQFRNIEIK